MMSTLRLVVDNTVADKKPKFGTVTCGVSFSYTTQKP